MAMKSPDFLIKSLERAALLLNKSGNHSVRCVISLTCFSMFVKGTKVKMRNVVWMIRKRMPMEKAKIRRLQHLKKPGNAIVTFCQDDNSILFCLDCVGVQFFWFSSCLVSRRFWVSKF